MNYQGIEYTPEEFIEHFGVQGMKWGVRTATIKNARKEVRGKKNAVKKEYKKGNINKSQKKQQINKIQLTEAGYTARTLTRGEQAVTSILGPGSLAGGVLLNVIYSAANNAQGSQVSKNRSDDKVSAENRKKSASK